MGGIGRRPTETLEFNSFLGIISAERRGRFGAHINPLCQLSSRPKVAMVRATRPKCSYQCHESPCIALVAAMVAVSTAAGAHTAASYNSNNALFAFGAVGGPASRLGSVGRGSLVDKHRVQVSSVAHAGEGCAMRAWQREREEHVLFAATWYIFILGQRHRDGDRHTAAQGTGTLCGDRWVKCLNAGCFVSSRFPWIGSMPQAVCFATHELARQNTPSQKVADVDYSSNLLSSFNDCILSPLCGHAGHVNG